MEFRAWLKPLLLISVTLLPLCNAEGKGFIGYGIARWSPRCPYVCRFNLAASALSCSTVKGKKTTTTPKCYASNDAFLETLAWCISTRCHDLELWEDEQWWSKAASGSPAVVPKYSYAQALAKVPSTPNATLVYKKALNVTSVTRDKDFQIQWNTYEENESSQATHAKFAIVLACSGLLVPIFFSLLRFVPLPKGLVAKTYSYLVLPATWGDKHRTPLPFNIGNCPTRGQALLIFYFCMLNLLLGVASYHFVPLDEQTHFATTKHQHLLIHADRIANMALGNLGLVFLYSARNNFLIWITNWQRSTFLVLHNWLGYIVIIEAVTHACIYLHLYLKDIEGDYSEEHHEEYWKWGIVGVVSASALFPLSVLPIRQKIYEFFRVTHNIFAYLTVIGIFMHVWLKNSEKGFQNWIYATLAVIAFDRVLRVLRIARNGVRMAEVTVFDEDYVRVDVKGITAEGHGYIYFPTLHPWQFWANHPFSVAASVHNVALDSKITLHNTPGATPSNISSKEGDPEKGDPEKGILSDQIVPSANSTPATLHDDSSNISDPITPHHIPAAGATFFVRRQKGHTSLLSTRTRLPVLIESSYGSLSDLASYPNLIAIVGGVGITAVLPVLRTHPGRTKLYWSLRTQGLRNALHDDMGTIDKEVLVGSRMDIAGILEREIAGDRGKGACVIVSGPNGLADEARKVVSEIGKRKGAWPVRFVDESFG